jgi:hypothetical protein
MTINDDRAGHSGDSVEEPALRRRRSLVRWAAVAAVPVLAVAVYAGVASAQDASRSSSSQKSTSQKAPSEKAAPNLTGDAQLIEFAKCMRANGYAKFPDPVKNPVEGSTGLGFVFDPPVPNKGENQEFDRAVSACKSIWDFENVPG